MAIIKEYDPNVGLYELEKQYIIKALAHFKGNKTKAANVLGIKIKTLYLKLYEYGMNPYEQIITYVD
jgi:two-component system response regulator HydG